MNRPGRTNPRSGAAPAGICARATDARMGRHHGRAGRARPDPHSRYPRSRFDRPGRSPKVGKSLYLTQTALTVGRSLLVFEEGSRSGIAYRLRRQAQALNIAEPELRLLHLQHIRLDNRGNVARLRDLVAEYRPVMVGLDPLNRLHGADENRPSQMTPVMDALAGIAYDFETAVVCIHHLGKPSMERRGDIWDRFRGARPSARGTDSNLILDAAGDQLHLVGEFRDAEPLSRI